MIVQEAPRTAGFGAELAAILAEKAILDLRGPVLRVTGYDVPYPYWQLEDAYMPSAARVSARCRAAAARRVLMAYEFRLPDLGEGLTEGEIARWLVGRGRRDRRGPAAGRDPDRQDDGGDPVAGRGQGRADPRRRGRGVPVGTLLVVIGEDGERCPPTTPSRPQPREPASSPHVRPRPRSATPPCAGSPQELGVDLDASPAAAPAGGSPRRTSARGRARRGRRGGGPARAAARRAPPDRRAPGARAPRGAGRHRGSRSATSTHARPATLLAADSSCGRRRARSRSSPS